MLVAQRDRRPAAPARRTPAAPRRLTQRATGPAVVPQHGAGLPLARTLARSVAQRASQQTPVLQRSGLWDSLYEEAGSLYDKASTTLDEVKDVLTDVGSRLDNLDAVDSYPTCEETIGGSPQPPVQDLWLDDKGLESLRDGDGVLSKTAKPKRGNALTLKLFKNALQWWGCDRLQRNLLPSAGDSGPFGPETENAVKQLQLFSFLRTDGVVGPLTMAALDAGLGVRPRGRVETDVGGSATKGLSVFDPTQVPAGRMYFANDDASLDDHDESVLEKMANELAHPDRRLKSADVGIVGYADKRESVRYNLELAVRRAKAVHDRLEELLEERSIKADLDDEGEGRDRARARQDRRGAQAVSPGGHPPRRSRVPSAAAGAR